MPAPASSGQLAIPVQLVLALEPQLRGDQPIVCGQGEVLLLEILVFARAPVPFAYHHAGVKAIEFLQLICKNQAFALVIKVDILICHDI